MVDFIQGYFGEHEERLLTIIANIVIITSLGAYLVKEFLFPWIRRLRLRKPVKASFVITSEDRYKLSYAIQDNDEHFSDTLVLPSNSSNLTLQLYFDAKLDFTQSHFELSFEGDAAKKPLIHCWYNPFVKIGENKRIPGKHPGHFVDYHDNYHIDEIRHRARGQGISYGFKISTHDPGEYDLKIGIAADGVDGTAWLRVLVENPLRTRMKCNRHWGCFVRPLVAEENEPVII
jgi:hypothetical protein